MLPHGDLNILCGYVCVDEFPPIISLSLVALLRNMQMPQKKKFKKTFFWKGEKEKKKCWGLWFEYFSRFQIVEKE